MLTLSPPNGGMIVPRPAGTVNPPICLQLPAQMGAQGWPEGRGEHAHLGGAHDLRLLARLGAPPVRPPMTRARWSGRTPSLSSASAVLIPANRSIRGSLVFGGISASASAIRSSCRIGSRRLPPGMHGPISVARYGRTVSLSCSQNVRHRTCFPGASHSSDRLDLQPGTGQSARHWPFGSRCAPKSLSALHQHAMAQSSAVGSPRPQAIK